MLSKVFSKLTFWTVVFWLIMAAGCVSAFIRFAYGLGASTHLSDQFPWGLWVGFDVVCGVGLAAGGFVVGAVVGFQEEGGGVFDAFQAGAGHAEDDAERVVGLADVAAGIGIAELQRQTSGCLEIRTVMRAAQSLVQHDRATAVVDPMPSMASVSSAPGSIT